MKAQVAYTALRAAARALKPYTTTPGSRRRLLYLHTDGPVLTLSAGTGDDTATVALPEALGDGRCALPVDTLIAALTAIQPSTKAAATAVVGLHGDDGRLTLTVDDRPTITLDTITHDGLPAVPAQPAAAERPVTAGHAADWYDLIGGVAAVADREPGRPDLAVVRLLRDHPHTVLMAEALGRHRIHRGTWGHPAPDSVDVRMPAAAVRRALRLLHALDPNGQLRVHVDDTRVYWRTDRIRMSATTASGTYPNLEKIREDVLADTTSTLTLDRAGLLTALTTVGKLAATMAQPRLHLQPAAAGGLDVVLRNESGAPAYTTQIQVARLAGPVPVLILNPTYAQQAVAFLDGDHLDIQATAGQLPVYLAGQRRHAIVLQIAT